jgi:hypothetical protein
MTFFDLRKINGLLQTRLEKMSHDKTMTKRLWARRMVQQSRWVYCPRWLIPKSNTAIWMPSITVALSEGF